MKIGDVVKINIEGDITSCIILSDVVWDGRVDEAPDLNYLNINRTPSGIDGYEIVYGRPCLHDCYEVLIGDKVVYVEPWEMSE